MLCSWPSCWPVVSGLSSIFQFVLTLVPDYQEQIHPQSWVGRAKPRRAWDQRAGTVSGEPGPFQEGFHRDHCDLAT